MNSMCSFLLSICFALCVVGCNTSLLDNEGVKDDRSPNAPGEQIENDRLSASTETKEIEGTWLSNSVIYHKSTNSFGSMPFLRIDVSRASPSEAKELRVSLPYSIPGIKLTFLGRRSDRDEWRVFRLTSPGWIDVIDNKQYFCFGPIGDHLRFSARYEGKNWYLQGKILDIRLSRDD